jgi:VWFA-related protein
VIRNPRLLSVSLGVFMFPGVAFPQSVPTPTFQTTTTNVLVDVVVTGSHGAPVEGLTKSSFSVFENGREQPIVSFEPHPSSRSINLATPNPLPPGVHTNMRAGAESDTVDVLLIDALNTPTGKQATSHQKLIEFLETLPPDKPMAIFLLNTQLRLLEDFTTDHKALLEALKEFTATPHKSLLLRTARDTAEQLKDEDDKIALARALKPELQPLGEKWRKDLQQFNAEQNSYSDSLRVRYTLQAFDQLARYLYGMPGRKNVIWVSGSFPLSILPDVHLKNAFQASRDLTGEVDHTAHLLANARVAIYPVDARGILTQALKSPAIATQSLDRLGEAESEDFNRHAEENMSQERVADATGGKAIYNTNDLTGALREVDRDGSHFYTLVYAPQDKSSNTAVRNIKVSVASGHYHLSYRQSYVAVEGSHQVDGFAVLMQHNVLAATQIPFLFSSQPFATQPASAPLLGSNQNAPRPVVRYSLNWDVDVKPLTLVSSADGVMHATVTLVSIAYDGNGKPLNSVANTLNIDVPAAQYLRFVEQGIHYRQQLDLPTQSVWLRAGITDSVSGHVGSLELPIRVTKSVVGP